MVTINTIRSLYSMSNTLVQDSAKSAEEDYRVVKKVDLHICNFSKWFCLIDQPQICQQCDSRIPRR
jgi:hypothetical protein